MDSTGKSPLQRQQIQEMVKGEVGGLKGLLHTLLAKKIPFFESQQESIKQNTPGISQLPSTTQSVTFMTSFKEQLDDIRLEIADAPSNETVRRVKALIAYVKTNCPKLDASDIRTVLDDLLATIPYTTIAINRTKTKDTKPSSSASDRAYTGKVGDIRRYIQDYIIKQVNLLAGQFLRDADYPRNYEELRDYFELNAKGKALAEKINKEKADIVANRERRIAEAKDKMKAVAKADSTTDLAEAEMAKQIQEANKKAIDVAHRAIKTEASQVFSQLGGGTTALQAMMVFMAQQTDKTVVEVLNEVKPVDYDEILLDMKRYAQDQRVGVASLKSLADAIFAEIIDDLRNGFDLNSAGIANVFNLASATELVHQMTPDEVHALRQFMDLSNAQMAKALKKWRPGTSWKARYGRKLEAMSKAFLSIVYILEGCFTVEDEGADEADNPDAEFVDTQE